MNKQTKKIISLAISGLIAGGAISSTAFANDEHKKEEADKSSCKGGKEGCKSKEGHDGEHHEGEHKE